MIPVDIDQYTTVHGISIIREHIHRYMITKNHIIIKRTSCIMCIPSEFFNLDISGLDMHCIKISRFPSKIVNYKNLLYIVISYCFICEVDKIGDNIGALATKNNISIYFVGNNFDNYKQSQLYNESDMVRKIGLC